MLLEKFIQKNIPTQFNLNDKILIAVSGGIDSMVLLDLCKKAKLNFAIAHCNFLLRQEESDKDEELVKHISEINKITYYIKKFDTNKYCKENKIGIQEAARILRYSWFKELLNTQEFKYLFTAHHQEDNLETIIINFFKGTGIKGLRGILDKNEKTIRPLIYFLKHEIIDYANMNNIIFREDKSNLDDKYTRNFIRLKIIPEIQKIFPSFKQNIINNISKFKEIENIYELYIKQRKKYLFKTNKDNNIAISIKNLLKEENLNTIIYELFKEFGIENKTIPEIIKLLNSKTGKYLNTQEYNFLINRKQLIISKIKPQETQLEINIENFNNKIILENDDYIQFKIINNDETIKLNANKFYLDLKLISFPLKIRKWQNGDYFYPLGLGKKKKLNKFFIDNKLSINEKKKIWLLVSGEKIACILNHRIDERFKIKNSTTQILEIIYSSN